MGSAPTNVDLTRDNENATLAAMPIQDSGSFSLQTTIDEEKYRFAGECHKSANKYSQRLEEIEVKLGECADTAAKFRKIEEQMQTGERDIFEKLQSVLEANRKKREAREKRISSLLKRMTN